MPKVPRQIIEIMTTSNGPPIPKVQICIPNDRSSSTQTVINQVQDYFQNYPAFSLRVGPITATNCDTVVTESNSLGFLTSQTDTQIQRDIVDFTRGAYPDYLEHTIQQRLKIDYNYELPVGNTLLVRTEHPQLKRLIFTPIRYASEDISATANVYHAFRSALRKARQLHEPEIATPLLGVGAANGGLTVEQCCRQLLEAYMSVVEEDIKNDRPRNLGEVNQRLARVLRK
jgi:hypothetical protein